MALTLAARFVGAETAQEIQLGIVYDPPPPCDTGSVRIAPQAAIDAVPAVRDFTV